MKARKVEPLNTPGRRPAWGASLRLPDDTFGTFAESFARFMGTARFLIWMSLFIAGWIAVNVWNPTLLRDGFPFQLLTLMLSIQASYAAPLILLAQNRQEDRDRVAVAQDRRTAAQSRADMDYLAREISAIRTRVNTMPTREFLRGELRSLLAELEDDADRTPTNQGS